MIQRIYSLSWSSLGQSIIYTGFSDVDYLKGWRACWGMLDRLHVGEYIMDSVVCVDGSGLMIKDLRVHFGSTDARKLFHIMPCVCECRERP